MAIPAQRQQNILTYLSRKESITIQETADLNTVSLATARRDLDELSHTGMLKRTHGGAVIESTIGTEILHAEKLRMMVSEKIRIAQKASSFIHDGTSIFLDSGTTTLALSRLLKDKKNLTIITNNLDIACNTIIDNSSVMIVTGGARREGYNVLFGPAAEKFIKEIKVDIVFMGADAIDSEKGLYNSSFLELGVKEAMLSCGKKKIVLTDHTKFSRQAIARICPINFLDMIITDSGIDDINKQVLLESQIALEIV